MDMETEILETVLETENQETAQARERRAAARLQRRREREQERRRNEQTRQTCQERNRERQRQRRATEQTEARQARQEQEREWQRQRRATEQTEARQARQEQEREWQRQRRATEQTEARQARQEQERERQRQRRAIEPTEARQEQERERQRQRRATEQIEARQARQEQNRGHNSPSVEEWMLLCTNQQHSAEEQGRSQESIDWCASSQQYPNIGEMPTFITRSKENAQLHVSTSTAAPELLQGKQRLVYDTVSSHMQSEGAEPLRMVVSGTAGTGKSFLIHCLKALLQSRLRVAAPTGVAAFNVEGVTLHSLLQLPTRGDFKDLGGDQLRRLQQQLVGVDYLVIDEMSMVGRKLFGQVDQRLRQAFPHMAAEVLGGCSCLLVGDFGQLPPVMDLPLYSSVSRSAIADLGHTAYQFFTSAVTLTQVMWQNGQDSDQVRFRELLLHLRDGTVSIEDWKLLMTRCLSRVDNPDDFSDALHLYPTREAAAAHNISKLRSNGQPIATINAVHSGPNTSKASSDDAAGLEPVISIARGARVMLTSNLWVDAGLVNGAMGTICEICYESGGPPNLPVAVMVKFDKYWGPFMMVLFQLFL